MGQPSGLSPGFSLESTVRPIYWVNIHAVASWTLRSTQATKLSCVKRSNCYICNKHNWALASYVSFAFPPCRCFSQYTAIELPPFLQGFNTELNITSLTSFLLLPNSSPIVTVITELSLGVSKLINGVGRITNKNWVLWDNLVVAYSAGPVFQVRMSLPLSMAAASLMVFAWKKLTLLYKCTRYVDWKQK